MISKVCPHLWLSNLQTIDEIFIVLHAKIFIRVPLCAEFNSIRHNDVETTIMKLGSETCFKKQKQMNRQITSQKMTSTDNWHFFLYHLKICLGLITHANNQYVFFHLSCNIIIFLKYAFLISFTHERSGPFIVASQNEWYNEGTIDQLRDLFIILKEK